jgi:hypothetical protein
VTDSDSLARICPCKLALGAFLGAGALKVLELSDKSATFRGGAEC